MAETRREKGSLNVKELEELYRRSGWYEQFQRTVFGHQVEAPPVPEPTPPPEPKEPVAAPPAGWEVLWERRWQEWSAAREREWNQLQEHVEWLRNRIQQWEDRLRALQTEVGAFRKEMERWNDTLQKHSYRLALVEPALKAQEERWETLMRHLQALFPEGAEDLAFLAALREEVQQLQALINRRWETERKARQRWAQRFETLLENLEARVRALEEKG